MRISSQLFIAVITFLALATSAHAQSPREQLNQMAQQLQKTPNDNALREKIIKLARTIKPSPTVPDAAVAFEGRAQFAFRSAKSEGDFLAAAHEYEKAVTVAPWVPGYYADLCTIYEKAGKYEDAKRHCGFYLLGVTDPAQMTDVKRRIAGLEFGIEKVNSQAREATLLRKKQEEKLRTTEGLWQLHIVRGRQLEIDGRASGDVLEVTQHDGRFEARRIGVRTPCVSNLTATATTIEWTEGTGLVGTEDSCHYRDGYTVQCHLRDGTKIVCQKKGYGIATGSAFEVQMIRRTSCKNFQYVRDFLTADCE